MDDISEKNDKIRISIFQTIFISKIILKCQMLVQNSKNQVDMIFYIDRPDFEMSQLARTSQLASRDPIRNVPISSDFPISK